LVERVLMGGPDGVSERKTPAWQDYYERPLPGEEARKQVNIANAPWAIDVDRLPPGAPIPPQVFANPAMGGPTVALAPPPTPPPAPKASTSVGTPQRPAAASIDTPLRIAPDAFHGIKLTPSAGPLPPSDRADTRRAVTVGPYRLFPELRRDPDGVDSVVFYKAVNRETKRADFVVGPAELEKFKGNVKEYSEVALRVFAHGDPDGGAVASMRVMETAMDKGFVAALKELPSAWNEARKDPRWVANTTIQVVTSAVPAARVEGAVVKEASAAAETEAVAAGGAIRNINVDPAVPLRGTRTMNCANCAIATDATLAGSPASALAGQPTTAAEVANFFPGKSWVATKGASDIEVMLTNAGPGSRGIVFGTRGPGQIGHFFNVANQNGTIRFLDGQAGGAANLNAGYTDFYLLRTN
jgi:hypothetical protein